MRIVSYYLFTVIFIGLVMPVKAGQSLASQDSTSIKIYTKAQEIVGEPFRDLGEVSGESCQVSSRDARPDMSVARKNMQIAASKKNANAIMLYSCQINRDTPECYRQAICMGSALLVER